MTRLLALALVASLLTACASKPAYRVAQIGYVGSQVLDLHSTRDAIDRGAHETNPLLGQSLAQQVAVKTGLVIPVLLLTHHLEKTGHRKVATAVLGSLAVAYSVIAYRNYTLMGAPQ